MNTRCDKSFLLAILLAFFSSVSAQELPHFTWFTTEQGLPDNKVFCVFEDSRGLIWIGSHYGLSLYLGNSFKNYLPAPGDPHAIGNAIIMDIVEDKQGHLWMAGFGDGLYEFDPATNVFKTYRHDPADSSSLSGPNVSALCFDRDGYLWVGTYDEGISRFDPKTGHFRRFPLLQKPFAQEKFWYNSVFDIIEDEDGRHLWLSANNRGIVRLEKNTGQTTYFSSTRPRTEGTSIKKSANGPPGFLWAATYGACMALVNKKTGAYEYCPMDNERWQNFSAFDNVSVDFVPKSHNEFWVATLDRGLAIFNTDTKQYKLVPTVPPGGKKQSVNGVYADKKGRLWVMNDDNGLSLYDPAARPIHFAAIENLACPAITADLTTDLAFDPARKLLFATTNNCRGLYIFKKTPDGDFVFDKPAQASSEFVSRTMLTTACAPDGRVWVGGAVRPWSGLVDKHPSFWEYRPESDQFLPVFAPELERLKIQEHEIHELLCEPVSGAVWIASAYNGLVRWDVRAGQATIFVPPGQPCLVNSMAFDPSGNLWFSSAELGVCALNPLSGQFRLMKSSTKFRALAIALAPDGKIWSTMDGYGVQIFDPAKPDDQSPAILGTAEGLPARKTCRVVADNKGRMWVSTERGLCLWDAESHYFKTFRSSDGLVASFLYNLALAASPDDEVLVGQINGINWLKIKPSDANAPPPGIYLTGMQVHGKDYFPEKNLNYGKSLSLAHDQNFFTLFFTSLQYTNPDKNLFLFRLRGVDKDWVSPQQGQLFAAYTGVPPGDYVFEIKTADFRGVWSEPLAIEISIRPPWWRRFPALLFFAAAVLGLAWWIWRTQFNRKLALEEARRLREMDDLKTRLYANITHEFRTPLTLMLGPTEDALSHFEAVSKPELRQTLEVARRSARRLLGLVNQILDLRRLEAGKMTVNLAHGDVVLLLRYVADSFHSLAESKGVQIQFEGPLRNLEMDFDREKMVQIFGNLLSNALKFIPADAGGKVLVGASEKDGQVVFEVKDTGVGIAGEHLPHIFERFYQTPGATQAQAQGSGIGLSLVRELVELLEGRVEAESIAGVGSVFRVWLPIRHTASEQTAAQTETELENFAALSPVGFLENTDSGEAKPLALVVEDNTEIAQYIAACLRPKFEIRQAANGRIGWELAAEIVPDIVVSDIVMPEVDGLELCKRLKTSELTSHIPIVLLTARTEVEDRLEGIRRGADVYLSKPFVEEELRLHCSALLALRRQLRARYNLSPDAWPDSPNLASPEEKATIGAEDVFFKKVQEIVASNFADPNFNVDSLSRKLAMSYQTLHRKFSALTDKTPLQFIQQTRLQAARNMLASPDRKWNVSDVAYATGFNDPAYFSRLFTREYGVNPSELLKN